MCPFCCGCGACGKPRTSAIDDYLNSVPNCVKCGAKMERGMDKCPACGQRAVLPPGMSATSCSA